jgi:hypothetical protein
MSYPTFPELSRAPASKTKAGSVDRTLRSEAENGMVQTRPRYTRRRRTWSVTIEYLTPADVATLDEWVANVAVDGANIFLFPDPYSDPHNPSTYTVRFSTIPAYEDAGFLAGLPRQTCKFELAEV